MRLPALAAFVLGAACAGAAAQDPPRESCGARGPGDTRPRIGLVLGGGGARGIAHLGVLRALEDLRVPVDCIAGTSMGALVGGLYASGMSVDDMEELVLSTRWPELFDDSLARPERSFRRKQDDRDKLVTLGIGFRDGGLKIAPGLLQGGRILAMFEHATVTASHIADFDLLPIPFRAVATDINSGDAVVLGSGSLAMAMRASMSLPGIFRPVEVDGRVLLDGGLVNQVPIDVVRAMGADVVIAVDVGTPLGSLDNGASLVDVVGQMAGMMTTGNTRRQLATLGERDILVLPELGAEVATGDFDKAPQALAIGQRAGDAMRSRFAALSTTQPVYSAALARRPILPTQPPLIEFVRLENATDYADDVLLAYVDIPEGEVLDTARAEKSMVRAYSLGTLSSITYEVVREDERTGVLLRATPKPQGPNYLQAGLSVNSDFSGRFDSNLHLALLMAPLSSFGAEGRVGATIGSEPGVYAQYYHPLDARGRNLLFAAVSYENPDIHVFNEQGDNLATYDLNILAVELKAGREFGNYGVASLGYRRGTGSGDIEIGDPTLESFDFEQGDLQAKVVLDRLDSLFFPRQGWYATLGYRVAREWLGSDAEYDQVDFDALGANSFGRHALQYGVSYHSTVSGTLPIQSRYRLGGRARLAGYRANELTGQHYALALAGYSYQLTKVLGRSAQVGGTLEYGNAWEDRDDISLSDATLHASGYLGFDSWVGPMVLGFGWREGGDGTVFLDINRPF